MKKAPKLSKQKIVDLAKTPTFWESLKFTHGSYAKAGKKLKLSPSILSKLGRQRPRGTRLEVSDSTLEKLQRGVRRMDKRDYQVAKRYAYTPGSEAFSKGAAGSMTPGQLKYVKRYAARGSKQAAYFRKAINDYYTGKTNRVLMGAIDEKGNIYNPGASKYQKVKTLMKKERKQARKRARQAGRRAIYRARRRGNK